MKRLSLILLLVLSCCIFVSCANVDNTYNLLGNKQFNIKPLETVYAHNNSKRQFSIYVSGAVQNEGYYLVEEGTSYADVVTKAGIISQTILPDYSLSFVDGSITSIVVDYYCQGTFSSVNVNGLAVIAQATIPNVTGNVVSKLANYIQTNGKIHNRQQLADALGCDYQDNYYKFYVEVSDYEQAN